MEGVGRVGCQLSGVASQSVGRSGCGVDLVRVVRFPHYEIGGNLEEDLPRTLHICA